MTVQRYEYIDRFWSSNKLNYMYLWPFWMCIYRDEVHMSHKGLHSSMENYRRESALKVARRNATKTPSKPLWRISKYQWGPGNRLHRSDQSGEVSSTKGQLFMKRRESVKLKESEESAKPKQMCHHQTLWHWLALLATDSLEPELA